MKEAYNLVLTENDRAILQGYKTTRTILGSEHNEEVKTTLYGSIMADGAIDAEKLTQDWFPEIKADVFLSHSHRDETIARNLAKYLFDKCGVTCFIDSDVWGYVRDLLHDIDEENCKIGEHRYDYKKRNEATSHAYMMLSVALTKMIDKTRYFVLLNTPEVIAVTDIKDEKYTNSPWIYYELCIANVWWHKIHVLTEDSAMVRYHAGIDFPEKNLVQLVSTLEMFKKYNICIMK